MSARDRSVDRTQAAPDGSKDTTLTNSHGRYLEARLIGLAKQAGWVVLDNGTEPRGCVLPEAHTSDMDDFIGQLRIILPASESLGVERDSGGFDPLVIFKGADEV